MKNRLLEIYQEHDGKTYEIISNRLIETRVKASERYAWGIPNDEALSELAKYQPIVEMGAGLGYWAALLEDRGVNVMAFDIMPPVVGWTKVLRGTPRDLEKYRSHTLFLCWPPMRTGMVYDSLSFYKGETVIFVAEELDESLLLERGFKLANTVKVPQWEGLDDVMTVWRRG